MEKNAPKKKTSEKKTLNKPSREDALREKKPLDEDQKAQIAEELSRAKKTALGLQSLRGTFGSRLTRAMEERGVKNDQMADVLGVSTRKVSELRNTAKPSLKLRDVAAICIYLHLEPELSADLIAKAGLHPTDAEEDIFYCILLRTMYRESIDDCNAVLIRTGHPPLFRVCKK